MSVTKIMQFACVDRKVRTMCVKFSSQRRYDISRRMGFRKSNTRFEDIAETLSQAFLDKYGVRVSAIDNEIFAQVERDALPSETPDVEIGENTVDEDFKGGTWDPTHPNYVGNNM